MIPQTRFDASGAHDLHPAWTSASEPPQSPQTLDEVGQAAHALVDRTNDWLGRMVQARGNPVEMGTALSGTIQALQGMANQAAALARTTPDTHGIVEYIVQNSRGFASTYQSFLGMQRQIGVSAAFSAQTTMITNWQFERTIWQLENRQMDNALGYTSPYPCLWR